MYYAVILILIVLVVLAILALSSRGIDVNIVPPHEAAGRWGEKYVANLIESVLRDGDTLLTNVTVTYQDKEAELDNVIINRNGVFIIEVKNYSGRLEGSEEDFEWRKYHVSRGGNVYEKTVKNPIRQLKRQIYVLAKYLDYYDVDIWIEGYAMILGAHSPVQSEYILNNTEDIDERIHTNGRNRLNGGAIEQIVDLLEYK